MSALANSSLSNQLKLNLNAFVDNLNLVNVVHQPRPIVIEKPSSTAAAGYGRKAGDGALRRSGHGLGAGASFEYIDQEKMSMYSYLIQRDLKTKEWMSKFESGKYDELKKLCDDRPAGAAKAPPYRNSKKENDVDAYLQSQPKQSKAAESKHVTIASAVSSALPKARPAFSSSSLGKPAGGQAEAKIDLKRCTVDLLRALEHLGKQLDEFKNERLKVVYNDPVEEDKQKRILLEQIKFLSRSMYNFQIQLHSYKGQFAQMQAKATAASSASALLNRLVHTMRQLHKTMTQFTESYPYRADNELFTEKLCFNFYKQLSMSVRNYVEILALVARIASDQGEAVPSLRGLAGQLSDQAATRDSVNSLLGFCDTFFVNDPTVTTPRDLQLADAKYLPNAALVGLPTQLPAHLKQTGAKSDGYFSKVDDNKPKIINVIRTSRNLVTQVPASGGVIKASGKGRIKAKKCVNKKPKPAVLSSSRIKKASRTEDDELEGNLRSASNESGAETRKMPFQKKVVQTARLFPNKRTARPDINKLAAKAPSAAPRSRTNSASRERTSMPRRSLSLERLNESIRSLENQGRCVKQQLMRLSDSNLNRSHFSPAHSIELNTFKSPAFKHFSSPKLNNRASPQPPRRTRSCSRSPNRPRNTEPRTSSANEARSISPILRRSGSGGPGRSNDSISDQLFRLRLKHESELEDVKERFRQDKQRLAADSANRRFGLGNSGAGEAGHYQLPERGRQGNLLFAYNGAPKSANLYTRLTMLRNENDRMRRKYENLNFYQTTSGSTKPRRPYEELYLENGPAVLREYESNVNYDRLYRPLRKPAVAQMKRVLDYAERFANYSEKTSITQVGSTKFNDVELFEHLSTCLLEECYEKIYDELESVNDDLTANLFNMELMLGDRDKMAPRKTAAAAAAAQAGRQVTPRTPRITIDKSYSSVRSSLNNSQSTLTKPPKSYSLSFVESDTEETKQSRKRDDESRRSRARSSNEINTLVDDGDVNTSQNQNENNSYQTNFSASFTN